MSVAFRVPILADPGESAFKRVGFGGSDCIVLVETTWVGFGMNIVFATGRGGNDEDVAATATVDELVREGVSRTGAELLVPETPKDCMAGFDGRAGLAGTVADGTLRESERVISGGAANPARTGRFGNAPRAGTEGVGAGISPSSTSSVLTLRFFS